MLGWDWYRLQHPLADCRSFCSSFELWRLADFCSPRASKGRKEGTSRTRCFHTSRSCLGQQKALCLLFRLLWVGDAVPLAMAKLTPLSSACSGSLWKTNKSLSVQEAPSRYSSGASAASSHSEKEKGKVESHVSENKMESSQTFATWFLLLSYNLHCDSLTVSLLTESSLKWASTFVI